MDPDPKTIRILDILKEYGTVRGFELQRMSALGADELIDVVKPLIGKRLITASGVVSADTIDRVQFAPLSSAFERSY
jgi:hypothetical protein